MLAWPSSCWVRLILDNVFLQSNNLETKVIQYDDSRKHWGEWQKFRQQIVNSENKKRLFITIADECHWGPVQGKVHDKMLNDYTISPDADDDLLQQENYIALLVSATPYNVLTEDSHLPERYLVVKEDELAASSQGLQLFDILAQPKSR